MTVVFIDECVCESLLTAFIYISRNMDRSGVVGDKSLKVRVYFEIIWNVSVLLLLFIFLFVLCLRLILLRKRKNHF